MRFVDTNVLLYAISRDPAEQDKIMHSMLITDSGLTLMAADTPNSMDYTPGTNYSVSLSGEDVSSANVSIPSLLGSPSEMLPLK